MIPGSRTKKVHQLALVLYRIRRKYEKLGVKFDKPKRSVRGKYKFPA